MNSPKTTLSIASSLVSNGVVDLVLANGTTTVLKDDEATVRALDPNDELEPPQGVVTPAPTQFSGSLPQAVDLTTTLWYDQSLLRRFSSNHVTTKQWLAKVVAFATTRFADPSLNVRINLKIESVRESKLTLKATVAHIYDLARKRLNPNYLNSYFCHDVGGGIVGIAFLKTACAKNGYAVNINEYFSNTNSELTSARVFVHEVGHNIGM